MILAFFCRQPIGIPSQKASDRENVGMSWRHHMGHGTSKTTSCCWWPTIYSLNGIQFYGGTTCTFISMHIEWSVSVKTKTKEIDELKRKLGQFSGCQMLASTILPSYHCIWHGLLCLLIHYGDVIMGAIASQITSLTIVYSTVYSDADQRKHQSSASLAFVQGMGPVNSPQKCPVTRKMFPFDDVIMLFCSQI